MRLVGVAGAIWGTFNGAYAIMFGFAPILLTGAGASAAQAGSVISLATWLIVVSIQAGGVVAQRRGHPNALVCAGLAGWGVCLLLLPSLPPVPVLVAAGLLLGLPVGVILSLPAEVLRPGGRSIGMGGFQTCNYAAFACLPPLAGRLQDATGHPGAPLYFAAALVLSMLLLFALFRHAESPSAAGSRG